MRKFGWITPWKLKRKISYLRSMKKPNQATPNGATSRSWQTFFNVLYELDLTHKLHHYY